MPKYDLVIRNGLVVDGSGGKPFHADVGLSDGRIVEVGPKIAAAEARETLDADGHAVTPGFIDPHTHFDGQATWDDALDPSFSHGVTTVVMGNCGVGFAPVRPNGHPDLINIMEGVEDIPGTALYEAMPWGAWETYPEYLAHLRSRKYAIDVGSHLAHGALRAYVLGTEEVYKKQASPEQVERMGALVKEAMAAGAMGLSTNRIFGHRSLTGDQVPGTFASEEELTVLMSAMGASGAGVLQLIPGGCMGGSDGHPADAQSHDEEVAMMGRLSRSSARPITFTLFQTPDAPGYWREAVAKTDAENAAGAQLFPQISGRPPGLLISLSGYHPMLRRETFLELRRLPLEARVAEMRKPEVKAKILSDRDIPDENPGSMENFICSLAQSAIGGFYSLGADVNYEPDPSETVAARAKAKGQSEQSVLYDLMLEHGGLNMLATSIVNFADRNLDATREMLMHPSTVSGLSDAGAHVKFICDASIPTFVLSYMVRDRTKGGRVPLETAVRKLSAANADLYGMHDRGRIAAGRRADINVIDLERIRLGLPAMHYDLPNGSSRILQPAHGYRATFVNGVMTRANDEDTGARPGRLVENAAAASRR